MGKNVVRYMEVKSSILTYKRIPQLGKLFLLASPRLCFCFTVQVYRFLFRFLLSTN